MLNLKLLETQLDEALEKETSVSIPIIGLKSEGGNLIYRSEPGEEREIVFMQKDTPENRESINKLFQEEAQRQLDKFEEDYIKILKERERRKINESLWSAIRRGEK